MRLKNLWDGSKASKLYEEAYGPKSVNKGVIQQKDMQALFQNVKNHTFQMRTEVITDDKNESHLISIPVEEKPLENTLYPQFAFKLKDKNVWERPDSEISNNEFIANLDRYEWPKLAFALHLMETNRVDALTFGAFKTGGMYPVDIEIDNFVNAELLATAKSKVNIIHKHWIKEQTEMPNKTIGVKNTTGSQQDNLFMSGIQPNEIYKFEQALIIDIGDGMRSYSELKGTELIDIKNKLDAKSFQDKIAQAKNDSRVENVSARIKDQIMAGLIDTSLWTAANIVNEKIAVGPWHAVWGSKLFSNIASIFENKLSHTETPKGYSAGGYGIEDNLRLNVKDNVIGTMQFAGPIWSAALQLYIVDQLNKNPGLTVQKVVDKLLQDPQTKIFLEGLWYRVPTESYYSILAVEYSKHLPDALGSIFVGAQELYKITGADADGDTFSTKMLVLEYKNGKLEMVTPTIDTEDGRHNIDVLISKAITKNTRWQQQQFKSGGPGVYNDIAKKYRPNTQYSSVVDQYKSQSEIFKSLEGISINAASLGLTAKTVNQLKFVKGLKNGFVLDKPIGFDKLYTNINGTLGGLAMKGPLVAKHTDAPKTPEDLSVLGFNKITEPVAMLLLDYSNGKQDYINDEEYLVLFLKQPIITAYSTFKSKENFFKQAKSGQTFMRNVYSALEKLMIKQGLSEH